MPHSAALQMLLKAYRDEIAWLIERANDYTDQGALAVAGDYLHRAHNLQAIIDG